MRFKYSLLVHSKTACTYNLCTSLCETYTLDILHVRQENHEVAELLFKTVSTGFEKQLESNHLSTTRLRVRYSSFLG